MYWYQTAIMLEKKQFQRLTCNHQEINFYYKHIDDTVHIITLVDTTKRYYYEESALSTLKNDLERKFLLRGAKEVNIIFVLYTRNIPFYKQALSGDLDIWIVDLDSNRLIIYENQPDDFLDLKSEIELSLTATTNAPKQRRPIITIGLVAINAIIYFIMYVFTHNPEYYTNLGANCWRDVFLSKEYYRLFTCMFMHSDSAHLVNNMLTLSVLGYETENKLGHIHFSVLYLISGLLSSLASALYYMHTANASSVLVASIGASGAIFGIYGAYIVITLLSRTHSGRHISVVRVLLVTFLLLSSGFTGENIDNMAHLSGLIVGIIISFIYCKCDKSILKYQ